MAFGKTILSAEGLGFSLVLPYFLSIWMRSRQKTFVCGKHWHKKRQKGASHISQRQFWHSPFRMDDAATSHCSRHPPSLVEVAFGKTILSAEGLGFSLVLPYFLSIWMRSRQKTFVCGKHWHKKRQKGASHELGTERAISLIQVCILWWMSDKVPQGQGFDPEQPLPRGKHDWEKLNVEFTIFNLVIRLSNLPRVLLICQPFQMCISRVVVVK